LICLIEIELILTKTIESFDFAQHCACSCHVTVTFLGNRWSN